MKVRSQKSEVRSQREKGPNVWTHRVGKCFGLTLWRGRKLHVELWICRDEVKEHTHPGQRVEVVPLFGWARFYRVTVEGFRQVIRIGPRTWGRSFTVPAGWPHWFTLEVPSPESKVQSRKGLLVFVNFTRGVSAAENLEWGKAKG